MIKLIHFCLEFLGFLKYFNFAITNLFNTQNNALENIPKLQHCVSWPGTHCYDEKTMMSFRKNKIIAIIIFIGNMFGNASQC